VSPFKKFVFHVLLIKGRIKNFHPFRTPLKLFSELLRGSLGLNEEEKLEKVEVDEKIVLWNSWIKSLERYLISF